MTNVICFKTRQVLVVYSERHSGLNDELSSLIDRFKLSDHGYFIPEILKRQDPKLGPYVGDCVHWNLKSDILPFPIPNYATQVSSVLGEGIRDRNIPDPFMHMDKKYKATYNIMHNAKKIYTRSDLVAHDDYIERLNKNVSIVFYIHLDEIEDGLKYPGAPSALRRIKACKKLKELGFKASIVNEITNRSIKDLDDLEAKIRLKYNFYKVGV